MNQISKVQIFDNDHEIICPVIDDDSDAIRNFIDEKISQQNKILKLKDVDEQDLIVVVKY